MNRLTVYFTSDTHAYLYPTDFRGPEERPLGLTRMRFPKDGNTLIIDGGDTIQGSPLSVYCVKHGAEIPMADMMNRIGYDYVTIGNHDFNNGPEYLGRHLKKLGAKCLCANVRDKTGTLPIFDTDVRVMENGLRVGLFGIVTDWVNLWEKPENLTTLEVTDPMEAARRAVQELREKADIVIGIYHGGVEKDLADGRLLSDTDENIGCRLCEELDIDLLLTGHQHIAMANKEWHGTHLIQTPCNAVQYGKVEMDENGTFRSELVNVTGEAYTDEALESLYRDLNRFLDTPAGHFSRAIYPEDKLTMAMNGSPIADFFNRVQLWASGADISCSALANDIRGFDREVTVRDVVSTYIYSNTLVVFEVTGSVLREALEQCATYFDTSAGEVRIAESFLRPKEAHYNYDFFYGIDYAFDLTKPLGQRVSLLRYRDKDVADGDTFRLVMCNYRATGAGDFGCYLKCRRTAEIQTEVSELIIRYISEFRDIEIGEPGKIVR